ncbi:MAG: elongation factor 1-beta [Candidatus Parvarchaeota archaeon]|jgi:translation elongation factor aEF-1 beta|nr:elongation factor 1-beta [Candidatus Parvarchaeota archaeon]
MAKVVLKIKALPKDISTNIDSLKGHVKEFLMKYGTVYRIEVEPLAFGLNVIIVTFIMEESEGTTSLEAAFTTFKDAEMSITDVSRMPDF